SPGPSSSPRSGRGHHQEVAGALDGDVPDVHLVPPDRVEPEVQRAAEGVQLDPVVRGRGGGPGAARAGAPVAVQGKRGPAAPMSVTSPVGGAPRASEGPARGQAGTTAFSAAARSWNSASGG